MKTLRLHTEQLQPQEPKSSGGNWYGDDFDGI
jgi:hypothetical protein